MRVPYSDLSAEYKLLRTDIDQAISQVIDATAFAGGQFVEVFEKEFAQYCGTDTAVGVGSGTEAIWLSLLALGIGRGDEVITVPNTFIATVEAILLSGATPRLVDVDKKTYTMNPELIKAAITPRTKAIIPVHLFGQMADMDAISEVADAYGLSVIEDACQAHGATWRERRAGSIGVMGCFSFYPGKNLGAYGEAGAVTTNDPQLAEKVRVMRNHGQAKQHAHTSFGWNARMDGIQAAILSVKLKHLDESNASRRAIARFYDDNLQGKSGIRTPQCAEHATHIYHVYALRVKRRDEFLDALKNAGIACGIHYPIPIHLQEGQRSLGYKAGDFPISEKCASQYLSLPMHPELSPAQMQYVTEQASRVVDFFSNESSLSKSSVVMIK